MVLKATSKQTVLIFGLPLLVLGTIIAIASSSLLQQHPTIAIGVTYDLCITIPLLYLFLIRNTKIPKITLVPVFTIGVISASYLLPIQQQGHLLVIKTYILPVVELVFLGFIGYKTHRLIKTFNTNKDGQPDFYVALKKTCLSLIGGTTLSNLIATEIAACYYCFFAWVPKKRTANQYTHYSDNGAIALFIAFVFVVLAETYVVHYLVAQWNTVVAWIFSISSMYFALQLLGHIKAMHTRPSELKEHQLHLKYGLFGDTRIALKDIEKVTTCSNEGIVENKTTAKLTLLIETHNIALHFKSKQRISKLYGSTVECDILLLQIDQKERFITTLNAALAHQ